MNLILSYSNVYILYNSMVCFNPHLSRSVESMLPSSQRGAGRRLSLRPGRKRELLLRFGQHMLQQSLLRLGIEPPGVCGHLHR